MPWAKAGYFGLNLAALSCIELIAVEKLKKEQLLQCRDAGLKVSLLWLNILLPICWAAVTPHF